MSTSDGGQQLSTNLLGTGGGGEQKGELTSNVGAVDGEDESPSTGVEQKVGEVETLPSIRYSVT